MLKIVGLDIIDLIPFAKGILFVIKEPAADGSIKISFYSYDLQTQSIASVTKNAYLMTKFGSAFNPIATHLGDYISCDAARLADGRSFVIYSTGEIGIFSEKGKLERTGDIFYHDKPARDACPDASGVWCVVPDGNQVIRFSPLQNRVVMRIGGEQPPTFDRPVSLEEYDGELYICCQNARMVKTISLTDFSVADFKTFDEPIYKYLRVENSEFVVLQSGVYLL